MSTKVMIINNKNAYFEYEFDLQPTEASLEAIDAYIEQVLGFEGRFTLSEAMWRAVRDAVDDISVSAVIELANAICKFNSYKINRILAGYTTTYAANAGIIYAHDDTEAWVTGYEGSAVDVIIASEYVGLPVTGIESEAFRDKHIKSVQIPNSVTSIGDYAFSECNNLIDIKLGNGIHNIGQCAFGRTAIVEINIPDGVTTIENGTFSECVDLISITIPNSVTAIKAEAFRDCEVLTTVNYYGSQEDWAKITIDDGNTELTNPNLIINYNYAN